MSYLTTRYMEAKIYGLLDPIDDYLKYIGKTENELIHRLQCHISEAKRSGRKNKRVAWIKGLLNRGLKPEIFLIDTINIKYINELEIFYIAYFKSIGCPLKNGQPGGDGQPKGYQFKNHYTPPKGIQPMHLRKYNGSHKGVKKSLEHRKNMSEAKKGKENLKLRKKIIATELKTNQDTIFESVKIAAKQLNTTPQLISNVLRKRLKTSKGYAFRYFNEKSRKIKHKRGFPVKVYKFNKTEKIVYNSIKEAAIINKVKRDIIYDRLRDGKELNGYKWKKE